MLMRALSGCCFSIYIACLALAIFLSVPSLSYAQNNGQTDTFLPFVSGNVDDGSQDPTPTAEPLLSPPPTANPTIAPTLDPTPTPTPGPTTPRLIRVSPADGEDDVAVTRETILEFSEALAANTVKPEAFVARFGETDLAYRLHLSPDGKRVTLFYNDDLPGSARIRVTVNGDMLQTVAGEAVDADADEILGGRRHIAFHTLSLSAVVGTSVCGHVFASEAAVTASGVEMDKPLENVTITVDGNEDELRTTTDTQGKFCLDPAPAGRFFVHIDGRTVTNGDIGEGGYYPFVGKAWESFGGRQTDVGEVYLPLIVPDTLQPVSGTSDTVIHFPQSVLDNSPEFEGVMIDVPANSLYSDDGTRGGSVGIAPVPPNRLPGTLPENLNFPIVITVQTDGATNFETPAPVCFPNLPRPDTGAPLPPSSKSSLFSFNHDTGKWGINGTMTVSADGLLVCSDAGTGILAPGWHSTQPGSEGSSDSGPPPSPCMSSSTPGQGGCPTNPNEAYKAMNQTKIGGGMGSAQCVVGNIACQLACQAAGGFIAKQLCKKIGCGGSAASACQEGFDKAKMKKEIAEDCFLNASGALAAQYRQFAAYQSHYNHPTSNFDSELNAVLEALEDDIQIYSSLETQITTAIGDATDETQMTTAQIAQLNALEVEWNALFDDREPYEYFAEYTAKLAALAQQLDNDDLYPFNHAYYVLERLDESGAVVPPIQRGLTKAHGKVSGLILAPNAFYRLRRYVPEHEVYSVVEFVGAAAGIPVTSIPRGGWTFDTSPDADGDGLTLLAEEVIGTLPTDADSDMDGISDGAEVTQGTNPLDGIPVATGVIASLPLEGTAVDICTVGNLAVVADFNNGLALVDVVDPFSPLLINRIPFTGTPRKVKCVGTSVGVPLSDGGVVVMDISDATNPTVTQQWSDLGEVRAMAMDGGMVYAVNEAGELFAIERQTGDIVDTLLFELPNTDRGVSFFDMQLVDDALYLYAFWTISEWRLYTISLVEGLTLVDTDPVVGVLHQGGEVSQWNRLFVDGGIAYASHLSGYNTFDLRSPYNPEVIAEGDTFPQRAWKQMVPNGSGLGLAVAEVNFGQPQNLWLYDIGDPTKTDAFLTAYDTAGTAFAVASKDGLAYVADGESGLQVVNYRSYDNLGIAPTITITTQLTGTQSVTVTEGQRIHIHTQVSDDVAVAQVSFFMDGELVAQDDSAPFNTQFIAPTLNQQTRISITANAVDTGGNVGWAEPLLLTIMPDSTPPDVRVVSPDVAARHPLTRPVQSLVVKFSEPIAPATLTPDTIQLWGAGVDGLPKTGDEVMMTGGTVTYFADDEMAILSFAEPLAVGWYEGVVTNGVLDRADNSLAPYSWQFRISGFEFTSALEFRGTQHNGHYVQVPDDDTLDLGTGDFTLEAWIKTTETKLGSRILSKLNPGAPYYLMFFSPNGSVGGQIDDGNVTDNAQSVRSTIPVNDGYWHHVAVARKGITMTVYIDGIFNNAKAGPEIVDVSNTGDFHIGNLASWNNNYFNGQIDEVRVWNVARSEAEIAQNLFAALNGDEAGLVGYWQFNEGNGSIAFDTSPNNHMGELKGLGAGPNWIMHRWQNHPH